MSSRPFELRCFSCGLGQSQTDGFDGSCCRCKQPLLLRQRYQVTHCLGTGGFGNTYLGTDMSLPHTPKVAIKVLKPTSNLVRLSEMRQQFEKEAATLSRVGQHPQIPRLLDWFTILGQSFIVQEFIPGITLKTEVNQLGTFDESQIREVLQQVLKILQYLQQQSLLHGDIKPDNLMRHKLNQQIMLIDFGLTRTLTENDNQQSEKGNLHAGTIGYAAPEYLANQPTFASDIYSLGATCIYLLRGIKPRDLPVHPQSGDLLWYAPELNISPQLQQALNVMLSPDPRQRTTSDDLQKFLERPTVPINLLSLAVGLYGVEEAQRLEKKREPVNYSEQHVATVLKAQLDEIENSPNKHGDSLKNQMAQLCSNILQCLGDFEPCNPPVYWQNIPGISSELNSILKGLWLGEFDSVSDVLLEIGDFFRFYNTGLSSGYEMSECKKLMTIAAAPRAK
jgi:serine/threonine protein kinase